MPLDDQQKDSQFYQMTQLFDKFLPPPGAGMPMTHPSTSDDFRQAEIPDIQPSGHYDYTSRGPTSAGRNSRYTTKWTLRLHESGSYATL